MFLKEFRATMLRTVSLAIVTMGFAQVAPAGMVGTDYLIDSESRAASLSRIEVLLAREDVARQLETLGVERAMIMERLDAMSHAELAALEGRIEDTVAGGDVLGLIGAVFVVLLILELVGVTNIFNRV